MRFNIFKNTVLLFVLVLISCGMKKQDGGVLTDDGRQNVEGLNNEILKQVQDDKSIIIGANQTEAYLPLLKGKRVGIVANQTSVIYVEDKNYKGEFTPNSMDITTIWKKHLVDSLIELKVDVKKVFAPEHGFRGKADAGELVKDGIDTKTQLPLLSLHGKNKKPSAAQLKDIDVVVFDIQDVGVRFYTYISSLHYVMEACAEAGIPIIVFDRPNPNGSYIDGPILEKEHTSFIGMHPIPVVHGMTIGEYAQMINGENWLKNNVQCDLTVIKMKHYNRNMAYSLPIKPSPNLPNDQSINLYPSLCFFEGTNVSIGRGTDMQFQVYGAPFLPKTDFSFTPKPNEGAKYPKQENNICNGYDLRKIEPLKSIDLSFIIDAYNSTENKSDFFLKNGFINKLAGTKNLQSQIENGWSEDKIKATWTSGLNGFSIKRKPYLLY